MNAPATGRPAGGVQPAGAQAGEQLQSVLTGLMLLLLALGLPAGHFAVGYTALTSALQTKAEVRAEAVSQLIGRSPQTWPFEELRLGELLVRAPAELDDEKGLVFDGAGRLITASKNAPDAPVATRRVPLYDAGVPAGFVEVQRSLGDLLRYTSVTAAVGFLLATAVFVLLRRLHGKNRAIAIAMFDQQERARVTLQSIGDAIITTDAAHRIDYLNPVAERLTQWTLEEARGMDLTTVCSLVDEDTMQMLPSPVSRALGTGLPGGGGSRTVALVRRDGTSVAIEESAAPIRDHGGAVVGGAIVFRDVTATRRMAQRITWAATHDALTGLCNRRDFETRVEAALTSAKNGQRQHAVLYLDLDQFKVVNDTCGHAAGDALLKQLAGLLLTKVRESDTLARLGGDEFGVLLEGCPLDRAKLIAADLLAAVRDHRLHWQGQKFSVGLSIGLVELTQETGTLADVFGAADTACYMAKEQGRNRVSVYRSSDADVEQRRREMGWAARLTGALEQGRFELHYQPYLALGDHSADGKHIEILLRLVDEDGKLVPPGSFLPAAERYNIMPDIDRWVIQAVFSRYAELCKQMGDRLTCAVNLSGATLNSEGILDFIREQSAIHRLPPGSVCFEITETAAISNMREATQFMRAVKALGFCFALDDFGIGASSLAYLKTLPVDYLKIDGSFIRNIVHDPIDRAVTDTINRVGHIMGLQTVGEYAESEAVIAELRQLGVDFAQGYGVQRPQPLPAVTSHQG